MSYQERGSRRHPASQQYSWDITELRLLWKAMVDVVNGPHTSLSEEKRIMVGAASQFLLDTEKALRLVRQGEMPPPNKMLAYAYARTHFGDERFFTKALGASRAVCGCLLKPDSYHQPNEVEFSRAKDFFTKLSQGSDKRP